jgi:hypothetical protein
VAKNLLFCSREIFEELIETAMMNVFGHPLGKAISRLYGEQRSIMLEAYTNN